MTHDPNNLNRSELHDRWRALANHLQRLGVVNVVMVRGRVAAVAFNTYMWLPAVHNDNVPHSEPR